jgi:hypothetical protein
MGGVQDYPVRTDHRSRLAPAALLATCHTIFGGGTVNCPEVVVVFGALKRLSVRAEGKTLRVDPTMDPKVPDEVARETVQRYNRFLEEVTGYSSKERAKRLRKSAGSD